MKRKLLIGCLAATAAFASGAAQATLSSPFANWTAWDSAVNLGSLVEDTFDGLAPASPGYNGPYPGYVAPGFIGYASTTDMFFADPSFGGGSFTLTGQDDALVIFGTGSPVATPITIYQPLAGGYKAFGLDLGGVDGSTTFSVSFNGGAAGVLGPITLSANPVATFFGVTSTVAITDITITPLSGRLTLDNVSFANTPTTTESAPEPSSMALLGLGMAALGWKSRRRAKAV